MTIALRAPQWQKYPALVRVSPGETHVDEFDPASMPQVFKDGGFGGFQQGGMFDGNLETQGLSGYSMLRELSQSEHEDAVLFNGSGRTYELSLRYPLGLDAPQPLLTAFTLIVQSFRLDVLPGPSPTLPIKQTLGKGPFISREEAVTRAHKQSAENFPEAENFTLVEARLLPEAEARRDNPGCNAQMEGHFDGIWMLRVKYTREGTEFTSDWFLNATNGEWLCGEEISSNATPFPVTVPPGAPTPAPPPTRVP
jgi:hypothetical protein